MGAGARAPAWGVSMTTRDGRGGTGGPAGPTGPSQLLVDYRAELLRWNQQINLLSRRDTPAAADLLIAQCVDAFDLWWAGAGADLAAGGSLRWFDLGSGGGLPAFVWLALLVGRGVAVEATLVEPRAKRAWFLERLARLPGAPAYRVAAARWGEGSPAGTGGVAAPILFTLKALRLSEAAILGGLDAAVPAPGPAAGTRIDIVRFQPAVGVTAEALARDLGVPAAGTAWMCGERGYRSEGGRYLAPAVPATGSAGLFVTGHRVLAGPVTG